MGFKIKVVDLISNAELHNKLLRNKFSLELVVMLVRHQ
jgi:hypothetical protein